MTRISAHYFEPFRYDRVGERAHETKLATYAPLLAGATWARNGGRRGSGVRPGAETRRPGGKERIVMTQKTVTRLDELWASIMPRLSAEEQRAGIVLLQELSRGEPVSAPQLAQALDVPLGEAHAILRESALNPFVYAAYADGVPRVEGFFGLATSPTHHRFTIEERTLWTWCAQDSLFLPELLGETARVESKDPETGEPVRLTISPEGVEAVEPKGVTVSMVVQAAAADLTSARRMIETACHFIFFFVSRASGERWVAAHPQTELLSLEEAVAFAKRQNARLFGQELARRAQAT